MIYRTGKGRASSGEAIGILLLDTSVPFIPGDVANATTYPFPVRFRKIEGYTVERAIGKDSTIYEELLASARDLVTQGVRAVTSNCGFMALHQKRLSHDLEVPVFLSSLLQIPFMLSIFGERSKVGVITADCRSLDKTLLAEVGVGDTDRLVIEGLEAKPGFHRFAIEEDGGLDSETVEAEVIAVGRNLMARDSAIMALLLECSLLPPYAAALQEAVGVPVFDFITMINYVFSAVVRKRFAGFI